MFELDTWLLTSVGTGFTLPLGFTVIGVRVIHVTVLAMPKRNPVPSSDPSLMLTRPVRCSFLSVLLVILATLTCVHTSAPLLIKPQLRFHSEGPSNTSHHGIETRPRLPAGSYRTEARTRFENLSPPPPHHESVTRRGTAVFILNRLRFRNMRRIVSLLYGPELEPIKKHILVGNNNAKPLTYLVGQTSPPCNRRCFFQRHFKRL